MPDIEGAAEGAVDKAKSGIGKRIGPLPLWGWGVALGGGLVVAFYLKGKTATTTASGTIPTPIFAANPSGAGSVSPNNGVTATPTMTPSVDPNAATPTSSGLSAQGVLDIVNNALAGLKNAIPGGSNNSVPAPSGIGIGGNPGQTNSNPVAPATPTPQVKSVFTPSQLPAISGIGVWAAGLASGATPAPGYETVTSSSPDTFVASPSAGVNVGALHSYAAASAGSTPE